VVVHVPTWSSYPTLNISHALAIILYVVASMHHEMRKKRFYVVEPPLGEEVKRLLESVRNITELLPDYQEPSRAEKLMLSVKRLVSTAMIGRYEVRSLLGFFRRVEHELKARPRADSK
jgi:tRNA/rRNA methyltransferase